MGTSCICTHHFLLISLRWRQCPSSSLTEANPSTCFQIIYTFSEILFYWLHLFCISPSAHKQVLVSLILETSLSRVFCAFYPFSRLFQRQRIDCWQSALPLPSLPFAHSCLACVPSMPLPRLLLLSSVTSMTVNPVDILKFWFYLKSQRWCTWPLLPLGNTLCSWFR